MPMRHLFWLALLLPIVAVPRNAPPLPSSQASGTLADSGDSVVLALKTCRKSQVLEDFPCTSYQDLYVAAAFTNTKTFYGSIMVKVKNGAGRWEDRVFHDGNRFVPVTTFPTGASDSGATFQVPIWPGDQAVSVHVTAYDSGTTSVTLTASDRPGGIVFSLPVQPDYGIDVDSMIFAAGTKDSIYLAPVAGSRIVVTQVAATLTAGPSAPTATAVAVLLADSVAGSAAHAHFGAYMGIPATAGQMAPPVLITNARFVSRLGASMKLYFTAGVTNTFTMLSITYRYVAE